MKSPVDDSLGSIFRRSSPIVQNSFGLEYDRSVERSWRYKLRLSNSLVSIIAQELYANAIEAVANFLKNIDPRNKVAHKISYGPESISWEIDHVADVRNKINIIPHAWFWRFFVD